MRPSCRQCMLKHLAQATILLQEVLMGYSEEPNLHWNLCIGHLAEASDEIVASDLSLANEIRYLRLELMDYRRDEPKAQIILGRLRDVLSKTE